MGTRKSLVNQLGLVNWCTRQLTRRALKTRSCSRLQPWMVHAWELFDWFICGPTCRALKTRSHSRLNFSIFFLKKKYWCYYAHPSRNLVSPVCRIFFAKVSVQHVQNANKSELSLTKRLEAGMNILFCGCLDYKSNKQSLKYIIAVHEMSCKIILNER